MASFGKFIKEQREQRNLSQTEFGALIKVNTPLLSRIENDRKPLSQNKLPLLAEVLKMKLEEVRDLYFADKFAKEAFENGCSEKVFMVAESETIYLKQINTTQGDLKF